MTGSARSVVALLFLLVG
ncbi:hypothetical protein EE612_024164 [Oryza sativa]|nr:hypothetical protein EE612_024164 [Oryza sativa]